MKSLILFAFLALLTASANAAMVINTPPSIVQCEPVQFTWSGGTPPYYLSLLPGGSVSADPLKSFPSTSDTMQEWKADIPSGTSITCALRDSTGSQVYSDAVAIQGNSDSSCLNTAVNEAVNQGSTSASGSRGSSTGSGSSSTSTSTSSSHSSGHSSGTSSDTSTKTSPGASGATSSGIASKAETSSTSATETGSSSASSSSSSSGAMRGTPMNAYGIAGLLGMVGAALL
ncbi:hypothetical protein DFH11DRAFT_854138 [Phellopilus nigrolimitatus]|nr:hypothetical protein DFH11DRAFT_854138 [Phellopilus nigrolimitatus]